MGYSLNLRFYPIDVTESALVEDLFAENPLEGVIHFAGFKAVGESVEQPLTYYHNNTLSTMVLAKACLKHGKPSISLSGY